jgi:two-component system OmpR family response regulator
VGDRSLVVLAEDNADLRKLLAEGLERVGLTVVRAENGADLVEKVRDLAGDAGRAPDLALIVTDVRMPVMDGITAIRLLREYGISTPVIFMTAYGDPRTRDAAQNLNSEWIDKPVGLTSLRAAVAEVLGLAKLVPS